MLIDPNQNHGYDNDEPSMQGLFVADGPFVTRMYKKRSTPTGRSRRRGLSGELFDRYADPNKRKDPMVIEGFENVEIYRLICKLLGIEKFMAPNNGTVGFWDRYLDEDY